MRLRPTAISLLSFPAIALAHGQGESGPAPGETMKEYAFRHMVNEHHIDAFDADSFFALHDLNSDGMWSPDEIEAIYGVHHPYGQQAVPDKDERDSRAKKIVDGVLDIMDRNKDGMVSAAEFREVGIAALPDFTQMGAEGHHYDVESEFYLHHEEVYHSTPETQTDESYNHPEDLAHFENHDRIELDEENRERAYQGLDPLTKLPEEEAGGAEPETPKTPLEEEAEAAAAAAADPNYVTPMDGQGHVVDDAAIPPNPRYTRSPKQNDKPNVNAQEALRSAENKPGYGEGPDGFKRPKSPGDKLRRNMPYKYKFRRNWGDF